MSNYHDDTISEIEKLKHSCPIDYENHIMRVAVAIGSAVSKDELERFASVGEVERRDGTISENVPLVLCLENDVEETVEEIAERLKRIIISALYSSAGIGFVALRPEDQGVPCVSDRIDDDWDE